MALEFDPYTILSVPTDATIEDIKTAYRRIARRLHPDVNPNNPGAASQFQDITAAHELLTDSARRRKFDEQMLSKKRAPQEEFYFSLRVTPSKRALMPLPEAQVMYLLAEIFPDPRAANQQAKRESRVNLTLVLDHSNSMNGTRLDKVKVAAHKIIDSLNPDDILSVITFNDRANAIIPATTVTDKPALKARISMMAAAGGTEIFQGLSAGLTQNRQYLAPKLVNHLILLTDGHTFGDQDRCIALAEEAARDGISISTMGLGNDWNDEFLDQIASKTGGSSTYISSPSEVVSFMDEHVRQLSNAFAERMRLSVAPDPDVQLELAFKLSPHPQPLSIEEGFIPLGSLQGTRPISVLLQFQMPAAMTTGFRSIARLVSIGDVLENQPQHYQTLSDISLEITDNPLPEDPPSVILDALSKLTLYRLQERAQEALERGDVIEATRRLENLATRLLDMGENELAGQVRQEASRVAHTTALSDKGRKTIKYQTRYLLLGPAVNNENT